jgi:hypothetical protein
MRIEALELNNIKSFDGVHRVDFDKETQMFAFSGRNGAGKSTALRLPWLIQKAHFISTESQGATRPEFHGEVMKYLTSPDSYARLELDLDGSKNFIRLFRDGASYGIEHGDKPVLSKYWNISSPNNLILYIDASKGFSEETLRFDDLTIAQNDKRLILQQAIYNPAQLFSGIYQQLVKDYIHDRLLPSKPDRLLYYHVASKLFTKLIPDVELKNFSGNHRPGEFVLLGKAGRKTRATYDVREFSSGEKALLSTLTFLCISKSVMALIIDEPENHFHESLLLEFMSVLHRLTEKGGIHTWIAKHAQVGKRIKLDWVEGEYKDHNLSQVIISTHSKSLIYKFFSIGKNFSVMDKISEMNYEGAEAKLRQLGLSTIYSKVLLVEGDSDNAALEILLKGRNVKIKPLNGSGPVIETFRRLADIKQFFTEARFVFLVDSDNKPAAFFTSLKSSNVKFYEESFVQLSVHEFENLFLDENLFHEVLLAYLKMKGQENSTPSLEEIRNKLIEFARSSLPQVYRKELSLSFQMVIERHFATKVWGNKSFNWSTTADVTLALQTHLTPQAATALNTDLLSEANSLFAKYGAMTDQVLLDRCDGKQVLAKASTYFALVAGVTHKSFREAVYHAGARSTESRAALTAADLLSRLD